MLHGEMVSQDDHNEMSKVMKMREDYFSYIKEHIDNVLKAYTQFFENLNKETYKSEKIHYDDIIVAIGSADDLSNLEDILIRKK